MALSDYTTAVVTGASSGIGEAIVRALCARGISVTAIARRPGPLDKLAEETGCRALPLDLRDRDEQVRRCHRSDSQSRFRVLQNR